MMPLRNRRVNDGTVFHRIALEHGDVVEVLREHARGHQPGEAPTEDKSMVPKATGHLSSSGWRRRASRTPQGRRTTDSRVRLPCYGEMEGMFRPCCLMPMSSGLRAPGRRRYMPEAPRRQPPNLLTGYVVRKGRCRNIGQMATQHATAGTLGRPGGSGERCQQRLGVLQVGGVKALREPAIDRREQFVGFSALALLLPQPC